MGYSGKRKQSRAETHLKASLAQVQTNLLDAQVALAEEKASNSQRLSDLEEVLATLGGAK